MKPKIHDIRSKGVENLKMYSFFADVEYIEM